MEKTADNSKIDLSIIIPTCNRANELSRLLQKFLEAQVPDGIQYEIILVDNNSTDNTSSVVKEFSEMNPHILYFLEREQGVSNARNLGIRKARGNILLFADDDVFIDKNWIQAYWRLFNESDADVAQGKILMQEELDEPPHWWGPKDMRFFAYFNPDGEDKYVDRLNTSNMAVRREVLEQYGGFSPYLGPGTTA